MNVLLVDDEGIVREGLALLISVSLAEARVLQADSLHAATGLLASEKIDLMFLDVKFGDDLCAGLAYLRELKDQGSTVPVIMLSAWDTRDNILAAIEAGAYGFIPKRVEASVTRNALNIIMSGGVYIPPSFWGVGYARPPSGNILSGDAQAISIKKVSGEDLGLTPRLQETAYYVSQGLSNKAIARKMGITENTVAENVGRVNQALGVTTRSEFMAYLNRNAYQVQLPLKH